MNIFFLHRDSHRAAEYHCDKHVVKMILETAQLLSTTHWETGGEGPYKSTHRNHPSSIWTRSNIKHYRWLVSLGINLCLEYTRRYGKIHKSQEVILWCQLNEPVLPDIEWSDPPQAMPDYCKRDDVVEAYRNYYMNEKKSFATWKTEVPDWFNF